MTNSKPVQAYRWIVFLAAAYYFSWLFWGGSYAVFGGPFRFLTNWALTLSLVSSIFMLRLSYGKSDNRHDGYVGLVAVLNGMVVLLYWMYYLRDPSTLSNNPNYTISPLGWYLHVIGPALQWFDVLFVHRGFRQPKQSAKLLVLVIGAYVAWAELIVHPLADAPSGRVTSGLPYPIMNNLELVERTGLYALYLSVALVLLAMATGLSWAIRRLLPPAKN